MLAALAEECDEELDQVKVQEELDRQLAEMRRLWNEGWDSDRG
jgi:hypothetical protein